MSPHHIIEPVTQTELKTNTRTNRSRQPVPAVPTLTMDRQLSQLSQSLLLAIESYQNQDTAAFQTQLSQVLTQSAEACQSASGLLMGHPTPQAQAVQRLVQALFGQQTERILHLGQGRAAFYHQGVYQTGWDTPDEAAIQSAIAMAKTFGCPVVDNDHAQLSLFQSSSRPSTGPREPIARKANRLPRRRGNSSSRPTLTVVSNPN